MEADGGGDRSLFGADRETVRSIFDVAAGNDSTVGKQNGGAHTEITVRSISVVGDGDGLLLQVGG
jgi:hypothetical protein